MSARTREASEWGRQAENLVCEWLIAKGYTIRETNWRPRTSKSEIDIIAQTGDTIVFVEVKARTDRDADPADAITPDKIKALVRGANVYLATTEGEFSYRFDVATINGTPSDFELDYLEDAFLPPLLHRKCKGW